MNLQQIYHNLKKDLEQIEEDLSFAVNPEYQPLRQTATHLLEAGGKRMRPVFVLLSGRFGDYELTRLKQVAVSLELIHMATLVHDDVIDDAQTRRGRLTVKAKWDNRIAMYTGDFILAQALAEIAKIEQAEVHRILSTSIMRMCLGEIDQIEDLYNGDQHLRQYLRRIKRKTALLMAISCQLGAIVSGAKPEIVRDLYAYGYYVGMAFQLTDDVLDIVGEERVLGKPAGSDLLQGNITLPVSYTLHHGDAAEKKMIRNYLQSRGEVSQVEQILDVVRQAGGIEYTLDLSKQYLQKAQERLDRLPDSSERESLRMIAEFIVRRSY
ncbi:heptaprenyl diphosphate synthase component II [Hazenella coriacea]|uniref:Heptaprenyl diphosphate synthase n=1 Tax=Hazenella coriacea TaxID=1179467 RepID=A0A4R3L3B4_9BACL|nr:heptaprenyl diphosphate synthase component II [Hazenella coriacea]TCS93395.1 heptaprenyl diphosphate synthase [Hazenella coriacea]